MEKILTYQTNLNLYYDNDGTLNFNILDRIFIDPIMNACNGNKLYGGLFPLSFYGINKISGFTQSPFTNLKSAIAAVCPTSKD